MEEGSEPQQSNDGSQNLNDLQSYLVHFNKEIGSNDGSGFQQKFISQMISASQSEKSTPSEEELPAISGEKSSGSEPMITDDLSESQLSLSEVTGSKFEVIDELSSVNPDIPDLSASTISSFVDENHTPVEIENVQGIMNSGNIMMIPVSNPSTIMAQGGQKLVQIVTVNGAPTLQVVNSENPLQPEILSAQQAKPLIEAISNSQAPAPVTSIDGTDPVAVLASVAANTSNVTVTQLQLLSQGNNTQLVAVQNAADSTQPQLVAVQTENGALYGVTNISQPPVATTPVQTTTTNLTNGSEMASVSVAPTLQVGGGSQLPTDGNFILIVNPSGEKDNAKVYDFGDNLRGEVVEEIIEADGTSKKVVKITQLPSNRQSPINLPPSAVPFGDQLMCSYCSYTSPKRYLLTRHMKTHSEVRPHQCGICRRGFKSMGSLQNHINTHTGVRPHKCKSCESAFTTSGELVRHIRYKHTFEKPHKCTECDYASVELSKLKRHIRMHTGERPYRCTQCEYASPDTYKLKRHMRIHTGEKPYSCDICHANFTQSNSLKAHKLIHSGNKPVFRCEFCPTTCGRKTDLKVHIQKLHNSDAPQACKKCGEVFPDRYHFKLHMKTHEGEKCYKCDVCDYAAVSLRHLEAHLLIHSGEKPYECDECEMAFRQKQLLRRHKTIFHNSAYKEEKDEQECAACLKEFEREKKGNNQLEEVESEDLEHTCESSMKSISSLTADQLIENGLLADMKEGKLGASPKVVVVHPDGRIEEVTAKLQSLSQSKPVDDFLVSLGVTGDAQFDQVSQFTAEVVKNDSDQADTSTSEHAEESTRKQFGDQSLQTVVQTDSRGDNQTIIAGSQSVQTVFQATLCDEGLSFQTSGQEDTDQLIINIDQKEAGTQATFDSENEEEKPERIIVTQAQPQVIEITQVFKTGSGPQTTDSTFNIPKEIKPVYVSILQENSMGVEEGEVPAKKLKLMDQS